MQLVIAEKPSVAKEIAEVLGAKVRRNGYFEGLYCKLVRGTLNRACRTGKLWRSVEEMDLREPSGQSGSLAV